MKLTNLGFFFCLFRKVEEFRYCHLNLSWIVSSKREAFPRIQSTLLELSNLSEVCTIFKKPAHIQALIKPSADYFSKKLVLWTYEKSQDTEAHRVRKKTSPKLQSAVSILTGMRPLVEEGGGRGRVCAHKTPRNNSRHFYSLLIHWKRERRSPEST